MSQKWAYTRSERNALVALLAIIFMLIILKNPIINKISPDNNNKIDSTKYFTLIAQIENAKIDNNSYNTQKTSFSSFTSNKISDEYTKIEINSSTAEDFQRLKGIGKVFAERIVKYRDKIGGFSTLEQLKEVYGIHDTVYQKFKSNIYVKPVSKKQIIITKRIIEINSASQDDFESLNGIGKVFAQRIIQFREKLGGFYSKEQLKDVYGIHDTVYQKIKEQIKITPVQFTRKINVNTATYEELTSNPYLFSTVAKQIIGYRTKVKPFNSIEDLQKLYYIKDHPEYYDKILPYISID
ncbi:MAG TPA: helix-hairpin-helix domain-containing protein [Chitinophagales bacterium]|nr:helix-hairpin-helix domain-containing protein [Chitinophagales bacterium]HND46398.1 helix-hairpin-helix domain-containing protein [Chitinophagales bacterium]